MSDCELTDTYSPAAIDMAPATSPAIPAIKTSLCAAAAAATPTIKLAVEMMPSLAPSTAALNHPMRSTRWVSGCRRRRLHEVLLIKLPPLIQQLTDQNHPEMRLEPALFRST